MDIHSHVMPALAREAADRMGTLLLTGQAGPTAATDGPTAGRTKKALLTRVELRGLETLTATCQAVMIAFADVRRSPQHACEQIHAVPGQERT